MRIHFLEQQLGYAKGLVQAAQIQLCSPTTDHEYSLGRPLGHNYDDDHAHDLHRVMEESCWMYHNKSCGKSASGAGPS
jgi:hypothetical protein